MGFRMVSFLPWLSDVIGPFSMVWSVSSLPGRKGRCVLDALQRFPGPIGFARVVLPAQEDRLAVSLALSYDPVISATS